MSTFFKMGLPESLNHTLQHMQFVEPTPVQAEAIPPALEGKDILGSAQTGTGKTGAYGIPLVARIINNPQAAALVLTPTRELAAQVMTQLQAMLGKSSKIKTALLIGGDSMTNQLMQLRHQPRVIVGTPGRINDHLKRGSVSFKQTDFLVLDETDRMLDMGFSIQIDAIMKYMPAKRQTLLFSATLPKNIIRIAEQYLNDPVRVAVSAPSSAATNIKQETIKVSDADKYTTLLSQLEAREGSIIIFIKTKYGAEKMAVRLSKEGHSADAIHGDLRQNKRDRVIGAFRKMKYRILVATDVAARGLDIPHIEHVINYDLPQCPEDYIHRIGRTARAGAEGSALNLVAPADKSKWYAIERLLDPNSAQRPSRDRDDDRRQNNRKQRPKKQYGSKNNSSGQRNNDRKRNDSEGNYESRNNNFKGGDRNKKYGNNDNKDRNYGFGKSNGDSNNSRDRKRKFDNNESNEKSFGYGKSNRDGNFSKDRNDNGNRPRKYGNNENRERSYGYGKGNSDGNFSRDRDDNGNRPRKYGNNENKERSYGYGKSNGDGNFSRDRDDNGNRNRKYGNNEGRERSTAYGKSFRDGDNSRDRNAGNNKNRTRNSNGTDKVSQFPKPRNKKKFFSKRAA